MPNKGKKKSQVAEAIKEEVKLELTPMIDVTFLILIFFMCTLKFKTLEGKLVSYLPTDKGLSAAQAEVEIEDAEIILKVPSEGGENWDRPSDARRVVVLHRGNNTPLGEARRIIMTKGDEKNARIEFDPPDTLDKVREYLERVRTASEESKAKINASPRTPHLYVVTVLNLMIEANFQDISYSGIPDKLVEGLTTGTIK